MATNTENPSSPNAIPVRSSSTGYFALAAHQPSKSVLRPLPEEAWLSPRMQTLPVMGSTAQPVEGVNGVNRRQSKRTSTYPDTGPALTGRPGEWNTSKEKIILGPYEYLEAHPGKDFRASLVMAFNAFLQVPPPALEVITRVVGMLHTSSLLIDDVQDGSMLRRGIPVAHNIFGTAQTINSANYVYFLALNELQKLENKEEVMDVFTTEMLNLHRGQGMDLYWRDTLTCPTEDDYLEMVQNKTGGLFRLAIGLMQAESPNKGKYDCAPLVNLMGLVFQICDDYLNLNSSTYTKNKGMCEDLTEGKFSFPVIHSIRSDPSNLQLINILKQKTQEEGVKRYAVKYMETTGSFEYTRKVVRELKAKAWSLIVEMDGGSGGTDQLKTILDKMSIE